MLCLQTTSNPAGDRPLLFSLQSKIISIKQAPLGSIRLSSREDKLRVQHSCAAAVAATKAAGSMPTAPTASTPTAAAETAASAQSMQCTSAIESAHDHTKLDAFHKLAPLSDVPVAAASPPSLVPGSLSKTQEQPSPCRKPVTGTRSINGCRTFLVMNVDDVPEARLGGGDKLAAREHPQKIGTKRSREAAAKPTNLATKTKRVCLPGVSQGGIVGEVTMVPFGESVLPQARTEQPPRASPPVLLENKVAGHVDRVCLQPSVGPTIKKEGKEKENENKNEKGENKKALEKTGEEEDQVQVDGGTEVGKGEKDGDGNESGLTAFTQKIDDGLGSKLFMVAAGCSMTKHFPDILCRYAMIPSSGSTENGDFEFAGVRTYADVNTAAEKVEATAAATNAAPKASTTNEFRGPVLGDHKSAEDKAGLNASARAEYFAARKDLKLKINMRVSAQRELVVARRRTMDAIDAQETLAGMLKSSYNLGVVPMSLKLQELRAVWAQKEVKLPTAEAAARKAEKDVRQAELLLREEEARAVTAERANRDASSCLVLHSFTSSLSSLARSQSSLVSAENLFGSTCACGVTGNEGCTAWCDVEALGSAQPNPADEEIHQGLVAQRDRTEQEVRDTHKKVEAARVRVQEFRAAAEKAAILVDVAVVERFDLANNLAQAQVRLRDDKSKFDDLAARYGLVSQDEKDARTATDEAMGKLSNSAKDHRSADERFRQAREVWAEVVRRSNVSNEVQNAVLQKTTETAKIGPGSSNGGPVDVCMRGGGIACGAGGAGGGCDGGSGGTSSGNGKGPMRNGQATNQQRGRPSTGVAKQTKRRRVASPSSIMPGDAKKGRKKSKRTQ